MQCLKAEAITATTLATISSAEKPADFIPQYIFELSIYKMNITVQSYLQYPIKNCTFFLQIFLEHVHY